MLLAGLTYGIYFVASRQHWDDLLQQIQARVTFELITPVGRIRRIVSFSATDALALGQQIIDWGFSTGAAAGVPLMSGFPPGAMTYTPTHIGPVEIIPNLADQSDLGATVPPYVYDTGE